MLMNEQTKESLSKSVSDILCQHDKQSNGYEVNSLINRWYDAKMTLINKLSKHPNWSEDALAIILSTDEIREIDSSQVYRTISDMLVYAYNQNITIDADTKSCIQALQYYPYQFIDVDMKYSLQQKNIKSNEGQKVSRLLNSLFTKIGLDKLPEYNKLYAKIADAYNPLTIKRTSILSVHPCDFLHMSYGTGWKSCHNLDDGCYMRVHYHTCVTM